MEFRNTTIIGVALPDRPINAGTYQLYAEIVIIERSDDRLRPLVYQLKKESTPHTFSQQMEGLVHLPEGAFMLVGEVSHIDRTNKTIHLNGGSTISYKYLVLTSEINRPSLGTESHEACSHALDTLIEALNIHKSLPENIKTPFSAFYHKKIKEDFRHKILTYHDKETWYEICNIANANIRKDSVESTSSLYSSTNRLSEVQL